MGQRGGQQRREQLQLANGKAAKRGGGGSSGTCVAFPPRVAASAAPRSAAHETGARGQRALRHSNALACRSPSLVVTAGSIRRPNLLEEVVRPAAAAEGRQVPLGAPPAWVDCALRTGRSF